MLGSDKSDACASKIGADCSLDGSTADSGEDKGSKVEDDDVDDDEHKEEEAEETDDKEAAVREEFDGISGWRELGSLVANGLRRTYMSMYALRDPAPVCPETGD